MERFKAWRYQCDEDDEKGEKIFRDKFEEFIWPKLLNKELIADEDLGYLNTYFDYDTHIDFTKTGHFSKILVKVKDKYFSYTRTFKYNKVTYTQPIEVVPCKETIVVDSWKPADS